MIAVENLTKSFTGRTGPVVALDDINLGVPDATICGVVGGTGSGKSTLARCVALRERPDRGSVRVGGTDLVALGARRDGTNQQVGLVSAEVGLSKQHTVGGTVALPLERGGVTGTRQRAKVAELLDLVGLAGRAGSGVTQLPAGGRQRLAVARALAWQPSVLVADDPTAAVDANAAVGVLTSLDRARSELGVSVLLLTGDADAVRRICDDVAVLERGHLVEHGNLLELATAGGGRAASITLPEVPHLTTVAGHDRVAEIVLVGFAAVGALLPETSSRFAVDIAVLGGGLTRFGDTPVARFALGVSGERADFALAFLAEHGATVHRAQGGPQGVAA
ncbi:MAG: methionine ABC transporter ATP-binding protein [Sciscionella sp.]